MSADPNTLPTASDHAGCCPDGQCCGDSGGLSRRGFLSLSAAAAAAAMVAAQTRQALADGTLPRTVLAPADKGWSRAWLDGLAARGAPTTLAGADLRYLGMPVGGGCCGQVYLGGDGRLWNWDVFNAPQLDPDQTSGATYAHPRTPSAPFRQGFVLRTGNTVRTLDAAGFAGVRFTGQYPIGRVDLHDPGCPLDVTLEAFSPFVPLSTDDSTLPATLLTYTLRNTAPHPVDAELTGWAESPVCLRARSQQPVTLSGDAFHTGGAAGVQFSATAGAYVSPDRLDIVVEDWETGTFDGWTATGQAFGSSPVSTTQLPGYFTRDGDLHNQGRFFVTSHNFRAGGGADPDGFTGTLTSPGFTVSRRYLTLRVSGGNLPGTACVDVLVDGQVVASATGADSEVMRVAVLDMTAYQDRTATVRIVDAATGAWAHVSCDEIVLTDHPPRPDVVFEDWERTAYAPWTVTGDAFGAGPVAVADLPPYYVREGDLHVTGSRFVTSHNFLAAQGDIALADTYTGTLTSPPFTVSRRYVAVAVGGGSWPGQTCVNVLVDGAVVASITGDNSEVLRYKVLQVGRWEGRTATIQLVDTATGGWGHISCDRIVFTDSPPHPMPIDQLPDGGTFAVAALPGIGRGIGQPLVVPSLADWSTPRAVATAGPGPGKVDGGGPGLAGAVRVPVRLEPGESATVRFALSWYFPVPDRTRFAALQGGASLRHHYATRFASAWDVAGHVAANLDRLDGDTRTWVRTWYSDSTLPCWFLERTMATASTMATATCQRFDNGRFYAFEGVYCCDGTCEHVWNYAQAVSRLFPELERSTREHTDLDAGFHPGTGEIGNRAEYDMGWAADGQCGTILRIYREHQMSPDGAFLRRVWPRVKKALQWVMSRDTRGDGTLEGAQPNTLDAVWYGEVAWMTGMYDAALLAGVRMATEVGDSAFADQCQARADSGRKSLVDDLWTGEYFLHLVDPAHPETVNTNRGCHIDQMFGQSLAWQLDLPRVFPADKTTTALNSVIRYNYVPDAAAYRTAHTEIPDGRWFAVAGEPGVIMTTFPHGGATQARGVPPMWSAMYFNEVWTGQEYQLAGHLLYEGLTDMGLAVTRAVHDRYAPAKRNPYNEIECSEHYARAMAGYGVYLAACGFASHGPAGRLAFAPKIRPEDFRAAFTAAGGWGLYSQVRHGGRQTATVEVRWGRVTVRTLGLEVPGEVVRVTARSGAGRPYRTSIHQDGSRLEVGLEPGVVLPAGSSLEVAVETRKGQS